LESGVRFLLCTLLFALGIGLSVVGSARGLIPIDLPIGLMALAIYSPAIVALVLSYLSGGRREVWDLLRPLMAWRVPFRWYGAALLLPFAINGVSLGLWILSGQNAPSIPGAIPRELEGLSTLPLLPYVSLTVFQLFGSLGEEIGWRGYALPRLQRSLAPLEAGLVVGLVWMFWHVPLFLMPDTTQAEVPFAWYALYVPAVSVLFTGLYNRTGGSLVPVTLSHAAIQAANVYLPVLEPTWLYAASVLVTVGFTGAVVVLLGRQL
jgi:hypothetical protein